MSKKIIEIIIKQAEATTEEVAAVNGHTRTKEILRPQYNSKQGCWRIVKKTNNGHGGWRLFGGASGYATKGEADGKIKRLVKLFPNEYQEG